MDKAFSEGYLFAIKTSAAQTGSITGAGYVDNVESAIRNLENDINMFAGFGTDSNKLQGDVGEFWTGDTFNIMSAVRDSKYKAFVDRSHDYASPDILTNFGEKYGLKYYKDAQSSVNAQAVDHYQRFMELKSSPNNSDLTFEQFLLDKGIQGDPQEIMFQAIYSGQLRIIPKDQIEEAIRYLKFKIAKEEMTRPEQVERYKDVLNMLRSKIEADDGTTSIELSRTESQRLAELAKEGKFKAEDVNLTTEQLIEFKYILHEGVKAGTTAAAIAFALTIAPGIYQCLEKLIFEGQINENELQKVGFDAIKGAGRGFLCGFISASLTTACKSGAFGASLKTINPSVIGGLTVVVMQTMTDSFKVVKGDLTQKELVLNLSKNLFVAGCGIGLGALAQLTEIPGAYLLGNFIGTIIGSFAYNCVDNAIVSFAIVSGWTVFGIVDQDYQLPEEVLNQLGADLFGYEQHFYDQYEFDEFRPNEYKPEIFNPDCIRIIRRGVIGMHQVGYVLN